ncbi:Putative aminoacrylate hydrolase RutD [Paenibacillus auburnensis]|uniref:Aminoacrylate hydrolase RutD n=1 Tax=Paenibacillus auburnensis TaxID=2905649 RepID=A0ABM9BR30_9BACL|nr:alpha/beta fold hydrolase [Paenibacillus auburnensis]CAH1192929.1 Putative aminoacrylate hydrolase RutD [Paenibacillus auburnensis]
MEYILENGLTLNYEYAQAKQPSPETETLVLIHGMGFDLRCWDRIISYLKEDYHILRYDFRGHGLSGTGDIDPTKLASLYTEHLHALVQHQEIDQFHILSHGAGCIIGLYFSKAYPGKVRSNVLLSLPLFNSTNTAYKYADYRKDLMKHQSMRTLADHVIPNVTLFRQGSPEIDKLYEAFSKVTVDVYVELLDFFAEAHSEIMEMFKQHTGLTLLLTGERDPMYPPYLSSLIASANPNCRFMTIYNSSNMVFYDQPEETYKQIKMFFASEWSHRAPLDPLLMDLHADFLGMVDTVQEQQVIASRLKVVLLKPFQVFVDDSEILSGWGRRSAKELLIYLLLNPTVTRDQLCEDLWKDMEPVKARNQLRVCLNHLKQLLNNDETKLIYSSNQQISLQAPVNVNCDLLTLLDRTKQALEETNPEQKDKCIQEIFQHIHEDMFRNLNQEWNLNFRMRLEIQLTTLVYYQADRLAGQGNYTGAIACLKYVLLFNPEEYDAYERIAHLCEQNNQKHEARKWRSKVEKLQPAKGQTPM